MIQLPKMDRYKHTRTCSKLCGYGSRSRDLGVTVLGFEMASPARVCDMLVSNEVPAVANTRLTATTQWDREGAKTISNFVRSESACSGAARHFEYSKKQLDGS